MAKIKNGLRGKYGYISRQLLNISRQLFNSMKKDIGLWTELFEPNSSIKIRSAEFAILTS